jgi:hypothetical protein
VARYSFRPVLSDYMFAAVDNRELAGDWGRSLAVFSPGVRVM